MTTIALAALAVAAVAQPAAGIRTAAFASGDRDAHDATDPSPASIKNFRNRRLLQGAGTQGLPGPSIVEVNVIRDFCCASPSFSERHVIQQKVIDITRQGQQIERNLSRLGSMFYRNRIYTSAEYT